QSKNLSSIDFKGYVKKLVRNLRTTFDRSNPDMDIRIDIRDVFIDIDLAIPCGLIINELVSNAFKYAFPGDTAGILNISMYIETDVVFLRIEDNGVGLPEDLEPATTPTLGIKLVQNLVSHQLAGELTISREHGTGFDIRFGIPHKASV
ncbi:MAG: ATP-binding protein, partial [Desulfobacterales bacterium]|nr:ATP-binding protein [Desulfobacterales bacterium]